ncbi:S1C family serine protease [Botrimarina mediterranea]|uniref:Serine protease HhoA n=1 Tax=Botrimarina mediterranea TaxID=2528022 RepID=A0A518K434_9BACT|nr:trypsin-like peptidase domain-containing protein [Botrimarina mediterranea]QDV72549.1 Putative serine protease HhoA precursor [Botrimarina mediterranea]QDV77121.1 Putative serine protease HhoA precursor [Planctomycetes bacterium K2D]
MLKPRFAVSLAAVSVAGLLAAVTIALAQRPAADPLSPRPAAQRPISQRPVESLAQRPTEPVTAAPVQLTPEELANIRVYEVANQSVVHVTTSVVQYHPVFGVPIEGGEGAGSGAILDREGHILTNHHVIDDATNIKVTFSNDHTYDAEVVGSDEEFDIAVLKISPDATEKLVPIQLGRSDNLRVGQKAYALGNPFGLDGTLTTGILSSLNRSLPSRVDARVMDGMIQTDAAMNPGNSGGPLLNTAAEMIGMCVAIRSSVGQNSGVGFAIPVDRVKHFVPELIKHGRIIRAYHGIVMLNETSRGLRIAKLAEDGPAEEAGLRGFRVKQRYERRGSVVYRVNELDKESADYLVAIDGTAVKSHTEFLAIMDAHKPGDRVVFTVLRDGQRLDVPLVLGSA